VGGTEALPSPGPGSRSRVVPFGPGVRAAPAGGWRALAVAVLVQALDDARAGVFEPPFGPGWAELWCAAAGVEPSGFWRALALAAAGKRLALQAPSDA
jgi:hypothetical protein